MIKDEERSVITIRIPRELKLQVEMAANADNRTINSWMINIIKKELSVKK